MTTLIAQSPAPRQIWKELLKGDPAASIHQTPEWLDCVLAVGGFVDASRLYVMPGGRQLVMPMVRRVGLTRVLKVQESLPSQWSTGGLVAAGQLQPEDVAAIWRDLVTERVGRIRIRVENSDAQPWRSGTSLPNIKVNPEVKSVLDLRGGYGRVWRDCFKSTARTHVRRAERAGLVVESDSNGQLVDVYYEIYMNWVEQRARERGLPPSIMLRRASRVEPIRKVEAVARKLGSACRIWVARLGGQPIAAAIILIHGTHATYWRGYSKLQLARPVSANNLLQKLAIESACEAGCDDYNMGWSGTRSLLDFKSSLGAQLLEFPVFTFDRIPIAPVEAAAFRMAENIKRLAMCRRRPS